MNIRKEKVEKKREKVGQAWAQKPNPMRQGLSKTLNKIPKKLLINHFIGILP